MRRRLFCITYLLIFILFNCWHIGVSNSQPLTPEILNGIWKPLGKIDINMSYDNIFNQNIINISGSNSTDWNYAKFLPAIAGVNSDFVYQIECWMRVNSLSDNGSPPYLKVSLYDAAGKYLSNKNSHKYDIKSLGIWQRILFEFIPDPSAVTGVVHIEKGTTNYLSINLDVHQLTLTKIPKSTFPPFLVDSPVAPTDLKVSIATSLSSAETIKGHPRIYINQAKVELLKTKIISLPYSKFWKDVKAEADRCTKDIPPTTKPSSDVRSYGNRLPFLAMAYLLTDEARYLDAARTWMITIGTYLETIDAYSLEQPHLIFGMALAYDWLYASLTPTERDKFRSNVLKSAKKLYEAFHSQSKWWTKDYLQNQNYVYAMAVGIAGLAFEEESPNANVFITMAKNNFRNVLHVLSPDGASHEGIGYWSYGTDAILKFLIAIANDGGVDMIRQSSYFKNTATFRLYSSLPGYGDNVDFADSPRFDWYGPGYLLRALAGVFKDGYSQALAENIERGRPTTPTSWLDLLWYDESVPPKQPDNLPLVKYFDNIGILVSRSDWTDSATWFFFKSGPPQGHLAKQLGLYLASHSHPDEGNVLLWANKRWIMIEDGYVTKKMTKNHNEVLIDGIGQLGEGSNNFDALAQKMFLGTSNISHYDIQEGYQYFITDLTRMYPPGLGIRKYERTVVMVHPSWLILRDDLSFTSPRYINKLFHFPDGQLTKLDQSVLFKDGNQLTQIFATSKSGAENNISSYDIPVSEQHNSFGNYHGALYETKGQQSTEFVHVNLVRVCPGCGSIETFKPATFDPNTGVSFVDRSRSVTVKFADKKVTIEH